MKSVIFNAEEVRATFEGRKRSFRAVIKPQLIQPLEGAYFDCYNNGTQWNWWTKNHYQILDQIIKCPFGKIRDEIFVKEAFRPFSYRNKEGIFYKANSILENHKESKWQWRIANRMKQHQSRITLRIKNILVERISDISEEDAANETGVFKSENYWHSTLHLTKGTYQCWTTAKEAFGKLWNKKYLKHPFESNCWVWKIEFEVVK